MPQHPRDGKHLNGVNHNVSHPNTCLNLLYLNACSILFKLDELHAICTLGNYHVICVVESWLCNTIADKEIQLPGYTIFRRDRDRHGGGILIFVKSNISCSIIPLSYNCEFLPLSVNFCRQKICIGVFYRPPCTDISYFEDFVSAIVSLGIVNFSNFILVGDFNIDYLNHTPSHLYSRFVELCDSL